MTSRNFVHLFTPSLHRHALKYWSMLSQNPCAPDSRPGRHLWTTPFIFSPYVFLNIMKFVSRPYDLHNETTLYHLLGRPQSTLFVVKEIGVELLKILSNQSSNFWSSNLWLFVHSNYSEDIHQNIELKFEKFSGISFNSHLYAVYIRQFVNKHYDNAYKGTFKWNVTLL
jgi:hypothetical protein